MATPKTVINPAYSYRYHAQWCGGPPEKMLKATWQKLRLRGINVASQAEIKYTNRPYTIPPGTNLVLINQENCNGAFQDSIRAEAKEQGIPVVPVFTDYARTARALVLNKIISDADLPQDLPEAVDESITKEPLAKEPKEPTMNAPIPSPVELLLNCDVSQLENLPVGAREAILKARQEMIRYKICAPLASQIMSLDDEGLLALAQLLPPALKDALAVACQSTK